MTDKELIEKVIDGIYARSEKDFLNRVSDVRSRVMMNLENEMADLKSAAVLELPVDVIKILGKGGAFKVKEIESERFHQGFPETGFCSVETQVGWFMNRSDGEKHLHIGISRSIEKGDRFRLIVIVEPLGKKETETE